MKIVKLFLRLAISIGFLSAVADRIGMWPKEVSAWGNWDNFLSYTQLINPWIPHQLIPTIGKISAGSPLECGDVGNIPLAKGKYLHTVHRYIETQDAALVKDKITVFNKAYALGSLSMTSYFFE